MSIYRRAEKEIDILERDLETETDPIERKKIEEEIREIDKNRYRRIRAELEWQYETMMEAQNE
jgi:hypothetical protein